ncbi:hypothetical protein [Actinokineospora diospyrosa]|nr:hypothetical protein [Actinokineospora diospyrosa]
MRRRLMTVTAVLLGTAVLGAAPASAAPLPFLAVDCAQTVLAFSGQPVQLARIAVTGMVTKAVRETPGLGLLRSTSVGLSFPLGPAIAVGTVPDGTAQVSAAQVADAVVEAVRPLKEIEPAVDAVLASVRAQVTEHCGMTLRAINPSAPTNPGKPGTTPTPGKPTPGQPGTPAPTTPNAQPVGGAPQAPEVALYRAAPRDYGTVPYASAGVYAPGPEVRYGGVPGYAPQFGILGSAPTGLRTVGEAHALPVTPAGAVGLPVMLAALALSVVTGALVRSWVLRGT